MKEEPGTLKRSQEPSLSQKEESESPKRREDQSKVNVSRVNWTFMVGSCWDLLEEYESDQEGSSSTSEGTKMKLRTSNSPDGLRAGG